jgi:hypothetical protein
VQAERRLIARASSVVLMVDSSKFHAPAGQVVCALDAAAGRPIAAELQRSFLSVNDIVARTREYHRPAKIGVTRRYASAAPI